ncbi:MAG TPA: efflux RND transporter periplasmic adaptor subunit [Bacteroidia bacterium]|jgi:HlyD family secretion protein
MKKVFLYIGIGVALLLIVIMAKKCGNKGTVEVQTELAKKRNIIETVSANGKIQPEVQVKISSDVSGQVVELNVKEGAMVKKGDVVAKINPEIYQAAMDQMTASLNTAKANLENSKARLLQTKSNFVNIEANYNRQKKLYDQGAISQSEFDNAKAQYESGKADVAAAEQSVSASEFNVKNAEAALKQASENLNKTTIVAPVNGKVIKLEVEKGERVVGTSQMTGTEMMIIASSDEMEVNVEVNENDIIHVHMNDTADIEVDAYLGRKFKGIVTEIANSANTTGVTADQVTNFVVKIRILQDSYKDLDNPFRTGMSATVDIQTKRVSDVVSVPIQAVTTRSDSAKYDENGKRKEEQNADENNVVNDNDKKKKEEKPKIEECVFIYDPADKKAHLRVVKTGIQDNNFIEIVSGLKDGEEVISGPYTAVAKLVRDGQFVNKTEENNWEKKK